MLDALDTGGKVNSDALIERSSSLQLGAAYAFLDRFEVGAHLPLYMQSGQPAGDPKAGFTLPPASGNAIGNLTLHGKARLWRGGVGPGALALGAGASGVIPMATKGQFTGSDKPEGRLLAARLVHARGAPVAPRDLDQPRGGRPRQDRSTPTSRSRAASRGAFGASYRVLDALWATAEVFGEATPSGHSRRDGDTARCRRSSGSPASTSRPTAGSRSGSPSAAASPTRSAPPPCAACSRSRSSPARPTACRSTRSGRPSPTATPTATASPTASTSAPTSPRTRTASRTPTAAPIPTTITTASPTRSTSARSTPRTRTASRTRTAAPTSTTTATASPTRIDKCPNEPEDKDGFEDARRLPRSRQRPRRHPRREGQVPERARDDQRLPGRGRLPRQGRLDDRAVARSDRDPRSDPVHRGLKLTQRQPAAARAGRRDAARPPRDRPAADHRARPADQRLRRRPGALRASAPRRSATGWSNGASRRRGSSRAGSAAPSRWCRPISAARPRSTIASS